MQCMIGQTLQCATAAIELRNLTHGRDSHADCVMAVHIHWHIWYFNFPVNQILCFVDCTSLYNLFQMKQNKCTLLLSIFISTSLHVPGNCVSIIRSVTLYGWLFGLQNRQPPIHSEKYWCRIHTVSSPDDGHIVAWNMYRSWNKYTKK